MKTHFQLEPGRYFQLLMRAFLKDRSGQLSVQASDQLYAPNAVGLNCLGVAPTSLRIILLSAVASL